MDLLYFCDNVFAIEANNQRTGVNGVCQSGNAEYNILINN